MRGSTIPLLLLAGACASAGAGGSTATTAERTENRVTMSTPDGTVVDVQTHNTLETRAVHVPVSPPELWRAIALAYADLGIPLAAYDSTQMYIGNPGLAITNGRLQRERMSRYLNCGSDAMLGALADRYDVRLVVVSRVRADPGGSVLETQVSGTAAQRGVSGISVNCASTGTLEDRLANAARLRLAGGHPNPN
jgi:hypothetical protein